MKCPVEQGPQGPSPCVGCCLGTCGDQAPRWHGPLQPHPAGHSAPVPAPGAPQPQGFQPGARPRRRACDGSGHPGHPLERKGVSDRGILPRITCHTQGHSSLGGFLLLGPVVARPSLKSPVCPASHPWKKLPLMNRTLDAAGPSPKAAVGGSLELTGTHAGCAAAPGRACPGAGPRLASQDPGAQLYSADCSESGSQCQHHPGSEAPRRGQPPAHAPQTSGVSVGRTKCSNPDLILTSSVTPRTPPQPFSSPPPRSHRQLNGQSGHPQGICALPLPGSLSLLGHLHRN